MRRIIIFLMISLMLVSFSSAGLISGGNMDVTMLSQEPDPVEPGEFVELRWKVENIGEKIDDVEFKILPEYPFSLLPGDDGTRSVGSLYGRQQGDDAVILYFKLKVDENAVEGNNDLRLQYKTKVTSNWNTLEPYSVRIQTDDAILSIVSVVSNPESIEPGKMADLKIKIKNEADSAIKNVKIKWTPLTITSGTTSIVELPFTPIGSTNEKTVYLLKPQEEVEVDFKMLVSPDAESKYYKVQLLVNYQDELGTDFSIDNVMGLVVGNTPEVSVGIEKSEITQANQKGEVSVRIVNKDVMDIKFVNLELVDKDCYTLLSPAQDYLGNIDSDDFETASFELYIKSLECNELPVILTYKDANNKEYEKEVVLPLALYSDAEAIEIGLKQQKSVVGPIITLLIIVGGLYWYFRRKKNKK